MNGTRENLWITWGTTDDSSMCWAVFMLFFSPLNPSHLEQHHLLLLRLAESSSRPVVPSLPHCHILRCDSFFREFCNVFSSSDVSAGFPLSQELHGEFQSAPPHKLLVNSVWRHTHLQPKRVIVLQLKLLLPQTWDKTIIFFPVWSSFDALFCFLDVLFFVISDSNVEFSAFHPREDSTFRLLFLLYFTLPVQHGLFTDTQPSGIMTWTGTEP